MNDTLTVLLKSGKLHAAEEGRVFCNGRDKPYRFLQTAREQAVRSAGFRALAFHDPRHAFTSRLVGVGVGLPTVKEWRGQSDARLTLYYAALSGD
jgi:integrase